MIQLQILSGKQAGSEIVARRFPFLVGRGAEADLRLDDAGVWESHLEIDFQPGEGFVFAAQENSMVLLNHERIEKGLLRAGDLIQLGSAQVRFWLAPVRRNSTRFREALTWTALAAIFGLQTGLICWLLR